jgi:hypothetical protein
MEEQQKMQQLTNSGSNASQPKSSLRERLDAKVDDILDVVKAMDNAIYENTNPIVEDVVKNPELIADWMQVGGVEKNNAEAITKDRVVKYAVLADKTQDRVHGLIQALGKSHDSLSKSHDSDTKS